MTTLKTTMFSPLSALWAQLRNEHDPGGSRRVSPDAGPDFYASLSPDDRVGLTLITPATPPNMPQFDAVESTIARRPDGQYTVGLWLRNVGLEEIFGELCDSIIEACKDLSAQLVPQVLARRLLEWQELLDATIGTLPGTRLRGLVAELLTFKRCLTGWTSAAVSSGWMGPLAAAQDFILPNLALEVKAASARPGNVRISSAEQLTDVPGTALVLAIVPLALTSEAHPGAFSPASLTAEIFAMLACDIDAQRVFTERLASAGYSDHPDYARVFYRTEPPRYFEVGSGFPRIVRDDVPLGVSAVSYDIELALIAGYEVLLEAYYGH